MNRITASAPPPRSSKTRPGATKTDPRRSRGATPPAGSGGPTDRELYERMVETIKAEQLAAAQAIFTDLCASSELEFSFKFSAGARRKLELLLAAATASLTARNDAWCRHLAMRLPALYGQRVIWHKNGLDGISFFEGELVGRLPLWPRSCREQYRIRLAGTGQELEVGRDTILGPAAGETCHDLLAAAAGAPATDPAADGVAVQALAGALRLAAKGVVQVTRAGHPAGFRFATKQTWQVDPEDPVVMTALLAGDPAAPLEARAARLLQIAVAKDLAHIIQGAPEPGTMPADPPCIDAAYLAGLVTALRPLAKADPALAKQLHKHRSLLAPELQPAGGIAFAPEPTARHLGAELQKELRQLDQARIEHNKNCLDFVLGSSGVQVGDRCQLTLADRPPVTAVLTSIKRPTAEALFTTADNEVITVNLRREHWRCELRPAAGATSNRATPAELTRLVAQLQASKNLREQAERSYQLALLSLAIFLLRPGEQPLTKTERQDSARVSRVTVLTPGRGHAILHADARSIDCLAIAGQDQPRALLALDASAFYAHAAATLALGAAGQTTLLKECAPVAYWCEISGSEHTERNLAALKELVTWLERNDYQLEGEAAAALVAARHLLAAFPR